MPILYKKSLFIFRRDLRILDNKGLQEAFKVSGHVIPIFIFDPKQVGNNTYKSSNALQFMSTSLQELALEIEKRKGVLFCFYGSPTDVVAKLIVKEKIEAVFLNKDYTPYSKERDEKIKKVCMEHAIPFFPIADALLTDPETILTTTKTPYKVFTAFFNHASHILIEKPLAKDNVIFCKTIRTAPIDLGCMTKKLVPFSNTHLALRGGRKEALNLLKKLGELKNYALEKDFPALNKTSHLSAHLKFGTCPIRETSLAIVKLFGTAHPLIRQLYWRDFFTYIAYHFPHVFGSSFNASFDNIPWNTNKKMFTAWCKGKTGVPLVDAGMRQLNTTGFMHNRLRMITASFLVKDLHIDWRWGERYFAQHLIDYDPAVNNGNWQWVASTGCDAQPYFRVFNPWIQQKKYDSSCSYIKCWIKELQNQEPKLITQWEKGCEDNTQIKYPCPIVDHSNESKVAITFFKHYKKSKSGGIR